MASIAKETLGKAVAKRASGSKPGPLAAFGAALVAGIAAAALTYKALRSGS